MIETWAREARHLDVFLNDVRVGALAERADVWGFRYDRHWLDTQRMPLSNGLPLRDTWQVDEPTQRPVFWFFENLLPEDQALAAIATQLRLKPTQTFELLAALGAESAGALTLLPPGARPAAGGVQPVSDAGLAHRLRNLPAGTLTAGAPKRMSLAGAQHKLAVIYDSEHDRLYEPSGLQASTHILKPEHPNPHYRHSTFNEYFCMQLAAMVDVPVPRTWLHRVDERHVVYLVERFDRRRVDDRVERLYALDACQLLGIPRRDKYEASSLDNLRACIDQADAPVLARRQVLAWIAFNVLIGNGDAHLKNLTFLREGDALRLAPAYDLVSTAAHAVDDAAQRGDADGLDTVDLVTPLAGETRLTAIRREHLRKTAAALDAAPRAMDGVLDDLLARILPAADSLLARITREHPDDAGALRLLRQVRHAVIGRIVDATM